MKNRIRKIIWSITIVFLLYGLLPYKLPQFKINNENELLIYSPECTCCPEFYIEAGELTIPTKFKHLLPKKVFEITLENGHEIKNLDWNLLKCGNRFIVSGTVIGVDSIGVNPNIPCHVKAIVRINDWSPNRYNVNMLSYDPKWFIPYGVTGFVLILTSITLLFWRNK
jgi:hypothetical protein